MEKLKKISVLFAMMVVFFAAASAKAQSDELMKLNGEWLAQIVSQDGNMQSTMKWILNFNSDTGEIAMATSVDANGVENFFVFEAQGSFILEGNQLKMNWDIPNSVFTLNPFAELMMGDQAKMAKAEMEKEFKNELKEMNEAMVEDLTPTSFKYIDKDGTVLEFNKMK